MKVEHNKLEGGVSGGFGVVKLRFDHAKDTYSREFFSTTSTSFGGDIHLFLDDETVIAMADQFASIARSLCKEEVAS